MAKIIGNTTATPNPRPDWAQTDSTKADFIKNKPKLGTLAAKNEVAKTDLAADVQASLDKADSALQSYTETDPTVPGHVKSITQDDIVNWNAKSNFNGDYNSLTNKPTIPTKTSQLTNDSDFVTSEGTVAKATDSDKLGGVAASSYAKKTDIPSVPVTSVAGKTGAVTLAKADVGLGNVENKSSATIREELTGANVTKALGYTPLDEANAYTLPPAGSALGGVKSGGDVTISEGVIAVKDDSHNHIIGNIDGLQSALDSKQSLTVTIIPEAADLNNYITPGLYGQNVTATAKTIVNNPVTTCGILLEVFKINETIVQILYGLDSDNIYTRRRTSGGTWGSWTSTLNTNDDIVFKNNVGISGKSSDGQKIISLLRLSTANNILLGADGAGYVCIYNDFAPSNSVTGKINLGNESNYWKNLYLTESITDGKHTATMTELGYLQGTTSNIQTQLGSKVPTSRTINGKALSANISLSASDVGAMSSSASVVKYTEQTLTDEQKAQARANIGAGASEFSGSYNDLTDKPTIPAAAKNGTLTIQKNGTTVTTFGANQSTNATANITVPTKTSDITNDSGFITSSAIPSSLKNPAALTFGSKSYDGSAAKEITAADLGLSGAMKFLGTSTTAISDGSTTKTITVNGGSVTVTAGNVVLYDGKEFVWDGSKWEELGHEGSFKVKQTAVASPSASGSTTAFIDTISQDANGNITATKKNVSFPVTSVAGKTGAVTLAKSDVGLGNVDNTADADKSVKYATSSGTATSATTASSCTGNASTATTLKNMTTTYNASTDTITFS